MRRIAMKMEETKINIGGLLRCCLQNFQEQDSKEVNENDIITCKYCGEDIILKGNIWEWKR